MAKNTSKSTASKSNEKDVKSTSSTDSKKVEDNKEPEKVVEKTSTEAVDVPEVKVADSQLVEVKQEEELVKNPKSMIKYIK